MPLKALYTSRRSISFSRRGITISDSTRIRGAWLKTLFVISGSRLAEGSRLYPEALVKETRKPDSEKTLFRTFSGIVGKISSKDLCWAKAGIEQIMKINAAVRNFFVNLICSFTLYNNIKGL
jgi:hypothetical protein